MIKEKFRKVTAFLLFVTTLLTAGFAGWRVFAGPDTHSDPQGAEQVFRMAEGFGTGADFLENNWRIETVFAVGTSQDITSDPNKYAQIKLNEHSDNGEKIIRLINGIRATDLERADVDYRAGIAFFKNKISMEDTSEFSAKFTVSMPDACVNEVQTGDEVYAREAGGNGMAFVMTSSDSFAASVNSGMGYEGIPDSLIIEMDSYFNGAYCNFNMSSSGYVNWAYDNQIYANTALGYLQAVADDTRNKGIEYSWATNGPGYWTYLNNNGYAALAASRNRRFDHVGVMLNGNSREHIGISYLNGRYPDFVASGKYVNINNVAVNTPSSSRDCATRFADEGDIASVGEDVDNRLFTFWLEYDGSRLCVRYANGSFDKAVRPADAQITVEGRSDLDRIFANDEVQIGFISSIGTSKAQHTIHSVTFANKYYKDGIKTGYTEKYYIESPDAADDFIKVNGKKYVLKENIFTDGAEIGQQITITDKSSETGYQSYKKADDTDDALYPSSVETVKADGTTVLYQFYDLPEYKIEYYLEQEAASGETVEIGGKHYLKDSVLTERAVGGTGITADLASDGKAGVKAGNNSLQETYKSFKYYEYNPETTKKAGNSEGMVAADGSLVIRLYFDRKTKTEYTEMYWTEAPEADRDYVEIEIGKAVKRFVLKHSNIVKDAEIAAGAVITDKSGEYTDYEPVKTAVANYLSSVDRLDPDGGTVLHQFFVLKPSYRIEYWLEVPEASVDTIDVMKKHYALKSEATVTRTAATGTDIEYSEDPKAAGVSENGTVIKASIKNFDGYSYSLTATQIHGKGSGTVSGEGALVIRLMFDIDNKQEETTSSGETTSPSGTQPDGPTESTKPSDPVDGNIVKNTSIGVNAPKSDLAMTLDKLIVAVLTDEEQELAKSGAEIKIILTVLDAGGTVSDGDKAAVEAAIKELDGYKLGQYLDVSLIKEIGEESQSISRTYCPVRITFEVPKKLRGDGRNYAVVRVHNGKAAVLKDMDTATDTVTVETDLFSTYAIVFYDSSGEAPKPPVATGVKTFAAVLFALGAGALLMLTLIYFTTGRNGLSEEKKERIFSALIEWGKKGKKLRPRIALALIFLILLFYYCIGRKTPEDCRTV